MLFVFIFIERMTWSKPITTGQVPGPRAGHTMTAVGSKLFIFGGGDGYHYLNDLHILDTGKLVSLNVQIRVIMKVHFF